jgi:hypothetical protein
MAERDWKRMDYLRVIGAGFGRTGTMSLHTALEILGYRTHHMKELFEHPESLSLWEELNYETHNMAAPDRSIVLSKIYEGYDATVDYPGASAWLEMFRHNPNAKVILSLHPKGAEEWYESVHGTVFQMSSGYLSFVMRTSLFSRWMNRFNRFVQSYVWEGSLKSTVGTLPNLFLGL